MIKNLNNYTNIMAIPFFSIMVFYFFDKKNRTHIENILLLFSIIAFFATVYFSYNFLNK